METVRDFIFLGYKITADGDWCHKIKTFAPWKKSYDKPGQHIKKQRHYFVSKDPSSQSYGFFSSHAWMWELNHKEGWAMKSWCFWTVALEKTLESPLDCKEIQPIHPIGDQSWIFSGRTDSEAEALILWPPGKELTHWPTSWCWERLKTGGKGDDRGWDGWMASPTQRTWVWPSSGSWWWTGKSGMLQSIGLQRVRHNWVTDWNWTEHRHSGKIWRGTKILFIAMLRPHTLKYSSFKFSQE